jgi:hypothetical protein
MLKRRAGKDTAGTGTAEGPVMASAADAEHFRHSLASAETHAWADKVLASEETVLAWSLVDYNGTVAPNHARIDAAIAEADPGAPVAPPPEAATLVAFPTSSRMGLVLTPHRLLVFSVGFTGGKKLLGAVPLEAVVDLRCHSSAYGQQLSVVMRSGAVIDVEGYGGHPVIELVQRLAELRTRQADQAERDGDAPDGAGAAPVAAGTTVDGPTLDGDDDEDAEAIDPEPPVVPG